MKSIKMPFNFSGGRVGTTSSPTVAAEQKIINVLTTNQYERVMRHRYGANINQLLYESIDDLSIADFIVDAKQEASDNISRTDILNIKLTPPDTVASYGNSETTLGITVVYRIPLAAPQVVSFRVAAPGITTEDTSI